MSEIDALDILRNALDKYGEGFSIHTGYHAAERQCEVEGGRTVGVRLVPLRHKITIGFNRYDGIRVSLVVEEASVEQCVETAIATVGALLKPHTIREGDNP